MHSHDFDLIAQLAEGSLLGDDIRAAEAAVESCDECRLEFEAQSFILGARSDVAPARLTDLERARLHRTVTEATLAPVVPERQRSAFSVWLPKLAIAAAAVAFVGVVGVGIQTRGASDEAASGFAAEDSSQEAGESTAMASEEGAMEAESALAAPTDEALAFDETLEDGAGAVASSAALLQPLDLGVISSQSFEALTFERATPGAVPARTGDQVPLEPFPFACVGAAVGTYGEEEDMIFAGVAVLDGRVVEILAFSDEIVALDPKTCTLVDSNVIGR